MDTVDYLLDEESPKSEQPDGVSLGLKPHQLTSLYRMCKLDSDCGMTMKSADIKVRSNIGILADLAGYGKTITFLAMIQILKTRRTVWMPRVQTFITKGYGVALSTSRSHDYTDASLIVVPDTLVDHWQNHIESYTDLSYEIVDGKNYSRILIEDYDILLCPARHYNQFIKENIEYNWNRVAFDEADSINIPNTEYVNARFLWLITNTYDCIPKRKNKGFLKDLFKPKYFWEDPIKSYFFPVVVKGADQYVKRSFSLLEPQINFVECLTPNFIKAVHNHISPRVLELISAGDIDGAIVSLGGNVDNDRNIIELVTRGIKNDILAAEAKMTILENLELPAQMKKIKKEKLAKKLETFRARKQHLESAINEATSSDCVICYDSLKHPTMIPCCNGMSCAECLVTWMKTNSVCPLCRSNFDPAGLCTISTRTTGGRASSRDMVKKDKIATLVNIIKENPEGKYIIFSGHSETFNQISQTLDREDITYGSIAKTLVTLEKFRRGELQVILLDAEHNGAGIEIPQATDVILYHQMRDSLETQAIARAQRPGREGRLRVWKLKYGHEYERYV